jgi:hypothetical protein
MREAVPVHYDGRSIRRRLLFGGLGSTAVVVAISFIMIAPPWIEPSPARSQQSSGVHVDGWYNTLQADEAAYCLTPHGSNHTITLSSIKHVVFTNLTAITTGGCSGAPPHWGMVTLGYSSGVVQQVLMGSENNTTAGGAVAIGNLTYTSQ